MKRFYRLSPLFIAAFVVVFAGCGGGEGDTASEETAETMSPELVAQGQEIFAGGGICFSCHGPDATGTQLAPNLTDQTWLNIEEPATVDKIVALIRTGVPEPTEHPAPMPPMGGAQLTDDQLVAVASYVYSLSH